MITCMLVEQNKASQNRVLLYHFFVSTFVKYSCIKYRSSGMNKVYSICILMSKTFVIIEIKCCKTDVDCMISTPVMRTPFLLLHSVPTLGWKPEARNSIPILKLKLDCAKIIEISCDNKLASSNTRK